MQKGKKIHLFLFLFMVLIGISLSLSNTPLAKETVDYVGPDTCKVCHSDIYNDWKDMGHANMLLTAEQAQAKGYPLPEGLSWDDITYTIGSEWKIRYVNKSGYIITSHLEDGKPLPGKTQWNVETKEWVDYHPGEDKAYTCGGCHTTGFSTEGHQGDLPGIIGTWQFEGVTCESCHGAGGNHVKNPSANQMIIDISAENCGQCHARTASGFPEYILGDPSSLSLSYGARAHKHRQQYWDYNVSEHTESADVLTSDSCLTCKSADNIFNTDLISLLGVSYTKDNATTPVTCISCHEGHTGELWITRAEDETYPYTLPGMELGGEADFNTVCIQCHTGGGTPETKTKENWHHAQGEFFVGSIHYESGVTCTVCHMALDTKSAVAYDLRNHTMRPESYGSYKYTCGQAIGCHQDQPEQWPEQMIEKIQTTVNTTANKAEEAIAKAENAITTANQTFGMDQTAIEKAETLLLQAKSHSSFVHADGSLGFHNPTYALSLLGTALDYSLQAESTAMEARSASLAMNATTLGGQVLSLQSQVTSLQDQTATLQQDLESLQGQIDTLESDAATAPYLYGGIGLAIGFVVGAAIIFAVRRSS